MNQLMQSIRAFAVEEEGSEVVEYALVIALVSIVLALALGGAASGGGLSGAFQTLVTRVTTCFTGPSC